MHTEKLARLIPGAKLAIIPDVSHGGPIQDPASFHHIVAGLLNDGLDSQHFPTRQEH